jgi:ribonuclease HII
MIIRAGIDEAGYGPVFGPLSVTCTAVKLESGMYDQNAFQEIFRQPGKPIHEITDSKKVFSSSKGLGRLERLAYSIIGLSAGGPITGYSELIPFLTGESYDDIFSSSPWFTGADLDLPFEKKNIFIPGREALSRAGISDISLFSAVISVSRFNRMIMEGLNKGTLLFSVVCGLLNRLIRAYPEGNLSIIVDRLGGRKFYSMCLLEQFPLWRIRKIRENSNSSAYSLEKGGRTVEIEFTVKADSRDVLVSASSLVSKYLRELSMKLFNRFFAEFQPGLKPTQGYPGDSGRFLNDIAVFMENTDSVSSLVREC